MLDRRPYGSRHHLQAAAREVWFSLGPADWREAFAHHPKIGDREALARRFGSTSALAEREQAGVAAAPEDVLDALARGNRAYEERFGFIFIVCATGKSAGQMLALLEARLQHDSETEIRTAAEQHAQITAIRLDTLTEP